ncbi:MAG: hypothetical protein P4N59_10710 [Negativicutes bacterium]|nr:hypothetical protein [Negativicutes bacterium]
MAIVKVIFVRGGDNLVDNVIAAASCGPFVHVAIMVPDIGLVESLGEGGPGIIPPCVRLSPSRKYDNRDDVEIILVDLPNIAAAQDEAERLLGRPYGYIDCITTGLRDMLGVKYPGDGDITDHCSETVARILRVGGDDILPTTDPDNISPMDEEKALKGENR